MDMSAYALGSCGYPLMLAVTSQQQVQESGRRLRICDEELAPAGTLYLLGTSEVNGIQGTIPKTDVFGTVVSVSSSTPPLKWCICFKTHFRKQSYIT